MPENYVGISDATNGGLRATVTSTGALKVDGSVAGGGTSTANQGTPGTAANAWFTKVVDTAGVNVANVFPSGAIKVLTDNPLTSTATLTATAATGAGTTVDFGAPKPNITLAITTSAGVSAGAVALEVSQDNTNWFRRTAVTTNTASTVFQDSVVGAWRYARGNVTTGITGGTVSATLMASG